MRIFFIAFIIISLVACTNSQMEKIKSVPEYIKSVIGKIYNEVVNFFDEVLNLFGLGKPNAEKNENYACAF